MADDAERTPRDAATRRDPAVAGANGGGADAVLAAPFQRALAWLVDFIISFVALGLLTYAFADRQDGDVHLSAGVYLGWAALVTLHEVVGVAWRGQTIGKWLVGVRVVRQVDGARPTPARSVARWALPGIVMLLDPRLVVFAVMIRASLLIHRQQRGWHDQLGGTVVITAPRATIGRTRSR